ncbi:hypothetical protein BH20VER1_BH20VER1_18790 [soil metagenome]
MTSFPLISIITPSFNQGKFIGETLESLIAQDYPNLEVIVQDGGSTDESIAIAQQYVERYPQIFRLFVEKDRGQAHALNLGFAKARGEILGFLNSDDTLYPQCLHSVAREIDPKAGRAIVFGRCLFIGEDSPYVGVEHPAEFKSCFHQLAIWERGYNTIPQPSTFWHRSVWETCGGFNEAETHVLDYDLFCRFSSRYQFHRVDELWSTYRMHAVSKSAQRTETEVLAMSIAASRRNWPAWWHPLHWKLALSHWSYERQGHERARHHARSTEQALLDGHRGRAIRELVHTASLSPSMAWQRLIAPRLRAIGFGWLERLVWVSDEQGGDFTGRYSDGWIGPVYRERLTVPRKAKSLRVKLQHVPQPDGSNAVLSVELLLRDRVRETATVNLPGQFELRTNLRPFRGRQCWLELRVTPFFVPAAADGTDQRKLGALLKGIKMV